MKPLFITIIAIIAFIAKPTLLRADHLADIARKVQNPDFYLKKHGPLVVLGNSSIDSAQILFLPEVHDDAESLTYQLLMVAKEKRKNRPFMVLDESLLGMKKSIWDIFSQKSLEIIAALEQRSGRQKYVPKDFEKALQTLANKFRGQGSLHQEGQNLWTLAEFSQYKTPFFGWDTGTSTTLTTRNIKMVNTLKNALKNNDRLLVMAGARHIPELEHLTSLKLLCRKNQYNNIDDFFGAIKGNFGNKPELSSGIGATAPIYDFLTGSSIRYAVVFSKGLYRELDSVVAQFKDQNRCFNL